MNKILTSFTLIVIAFSFSIFHSAAQPTNKINYQSVARSSSGSILANQNISIRITIEDGSGGSPLYVETNSATTNQFGLFTLQVGGGSAVSGSYSSIAWANGNQWIKVEMDPTGGNSYVNMGESQLLSVPFANYAASAPATVYTAGTGIDITSGTITNTAPDQTVTLTGTGATSVTGTYPNFTINSTDNNTTYTAGAGLNLSGNTFSIPSSAVTNAMLADSSVTVSAGTGLTGGGSVSLGGTTTLNLSNTGIIAGTYGSITGIPVLTIDAQGRVTAATETYGAPATSINFKKAITGFLLVPFSSPASIPWDSSVYVNNCSFSGDTAFVAPSTGLYHFDFSTRFQGTLTYDAAVNFYLYVNSTPVAYRVFNFEYDSNTGSNFGTATYADNLQLNSGDKVYIKMYRSTIAFYMPGTNSTSFSGFKLY